jgi:hypothetical protein
MTTPNLTSIAVRNTVAHPASSAFAELGGLAARLLPDLPEAIALRLDVPGAPVPVWIHSGAATQSEMRALAERIEFDGREFAALVAGVEADRVWHRELLGFCFEKWRNPSFRLTTAVALAGVNPDERVEWSLERLLMRLQARVVEIVFIRDLRETAAALSTAA